MKTTSLLAVGALAFVGASTVEGKGPGNGGGKEGCVCTGECSAMGDPHIQNIFGEQWVETAGKFTLFQDGGFHVTADTFGRYYMNEINFGGKTVNVKSCTKAGSLSEGTQTYKSGKGTIVEMTVDCAKPKVNGKNADWHLDMHMTITSHSEIGQMKNVGGLCMQHHNGGSGESSDTDKVIFKKNKPAKCECLAKCSVLGDPHLTSFYKKQELLKATEIDLYKVKGFEIKAKVDENKYIHHIDVNGNQQFDLSQCDNMRLGAKGKKLGDFSQKFGNDGTRVTGQVNCMIETYGRMKGTPFLNFYLNKIDVASGKQVAEDFHTLEVASGSSGVCTSE